MSIVSPRPILISDLTAIKSSEYELYERRARLFSKPGITGYWQVHGERAKGT